MDKGTEQPQVSKEQIEGEVEKRKILSLVEKYKDKLGTFEVVPVGNAGFLLQSERHKPLAGNDWFMFDYDDTLVGTTAVKDKRLDLYKDYAKSLGINAADEDLERIMDKTDEFSRWENEAKGEAAYHANNHMSALDWATNELRDAGERKNNGEDVVMEDEVVRIEQTLNRIKAEIKGEGLAEPSDPFYFRANDRKMILKGKIPWSKDIENIFMQTTINPPYYEEALHAASDIDQHEDSILRVNTGVFTHGEPYYQLLKVFELLEKNPDLPLSQIWLAKVPKGSFIEEFVRTRATQQTKLDYLPPLGEIDKNSQEASISNSSGHPLGQHPHVIVMVDDSPTELNSILKANPYLSENTGASFVVVRSRRSSTKEGEKEWEIKTLFGEVDFRSGALAGKDVVKILQINRYLSLKSKLGEDDPRVKAIGDNLHMLGVSETELQSVA